MVLRPEVVDAFNTLGVTPDVDETVACRAYKKLALLHHPDRNHGDGTSTARFQQIGAAWGVCQAHYENPLSSEVRNPSAGGPGGARYAPFWDVDPDDLEDFFEQMMREVFMTGRFQRRGSGGFGGRGGGGGPRFQYRGYGGGGIHSYHSDFADSQSSHLSNVDMQKKEKEEFKKRMQEFEREVEAEQREIERAARETKVAEDRRTSARVNAFELARSGDSSTVRRVIEEHHLDVNGPERMSKNPMKSQPEKYDTLLHAAASHCDRDLISFLVEKGALLTILNKADLTPFHVSILAGNTPVTVYFLNRRAKSQDGCHPSKAAPDGRTPLQLAIASKNPSMVELMLKDATVHDVERLWEQPSLPSALKKILETKKGFIPSEIQENGTPMSRRARQKLEMMRKEATEKEEKEKRLAEERARAEENARRRQERRDKRVAEEERKAEEQRRIEEEERKRVAVEKARLALERETHRKAEEEACRVQEETDRKEKERQLAEEHRQREMEAKAQRDAAEARACQRAEVEARQKEREKRRKEQEERQRVREEHERERERHKREKEEREKAEIAARELIALQDAQRQIEAIRRAEERQRKAELVESKKQKKVEADAAAKRVETLARLKAQAEEMQRKREAVASVVVEEVDENRVATMHKRAEQSARDKARYQQLKAEKTKLAAVRVTEIASVSSQSIAAPTKPRAKNRKPRQLAANGTSVTHPSMSKTPLTPTSMTSSPLSWSMNPTERQGSLSQMSALISPPMTPESLQTCAIPDDLFRYERPPGMGDDISNQQEFYSLASPDQSPSRGYVPRGRGRGWRGRGRGRGLGQRPDGDLERHENPSTKEQGFKGSSRRGARVRTDLARPAVSELMR